MPSPDFALTGVCLIGFGVIVLIAAWHGDSIDREREQREEAEQTKRRPRRLSNAEFCRRYPVLAERMGRRIH